MYIYTLLSRFLTMHKTSHNRNGSGTLLPVVQQGRSTPSAVG